MKTAMEIEMTTMMKGKRRRYELSNEPIDEDQMLEMDVNEYNEICNISVKKRIEID